MFQGYYQLTSSMLTQTRNLNVISNNMANVSTPGYKKDQFVSRSFEEEMVMRSENKAQVGGEEIGSIGKGVGADRNYTEFTQGAFKTTTSPLDFALSTPGFFALQNADGETVYTRNGSFSLDGEGYLVVQGIGQVLGESGDPILLGTDNISADAEGNIYNENTGEYVDKLAVVDFADYDADLVKGVGDAFLALDGAVATPAEEVHIRNKTLEASNVEAVVEMTNMMASSKALQSSAQVMSMYDSLMAQIVNIARVN